MHKTTELLLKRGSFSGDAFLSTDYANDAIVKGYAFEVEFRLTIAGSGTADVWINYSSYTDHSDIVHSNGARVGRIGAVVINPPDMSATAGPVFIDVYRTPTVTPETGTEIRRIRKNTTVDNFPQVEWILNPTVTDVGQAPFQYLVGTQGQGNVSGGGSSLTGSPFYRGTDGSTLVRIANQNAQAITFHYSQLWYEI